MVTTIIVSKNHNLKTTFLGYFDVSLIHAGLPSFLQIVEDYYITPCHMGILFLFTDLFYDYMAIICYFLLLLILKWFPRVRFVHLCIPHSLNTYLSNA